MMDDYENKEKVETKNNLNEDNFRKKKSSQQQMQSLLEPVGKNINAVAKIQQSTKKILEPLQPMLQMQTNSSLMRDMYKRQIEASSSALIRKQIEEMSNILKKTFIKNFDTGVISEAARMMMREISEAIQRIKIPDISAEHKQEIIEAYKAWGIYGWTIDPEASIKAFSYNPGDKKTVDNIALKRYSKEKMEQIFEMIRESKRVKKLDFEEAVFDYQHKQYKSCALILFSLIDALLIRLQKKSNLDGKRRKVGLGAVNAAQKRTETDLNTELFFTHMFCTNLFVCLGKVFEGGKDFKNQPDVINRNFLGHGMMTKQVRKKDCIQLFLLYYNTLELLDMIY